MMQLNSLWLKKCFKASQACGPSSLALSIMHRSVRSVDNLIALAVCSSRLQLLLGTKPRDALSMCKLSTQRIALAAHLQRLQLGCEP